MIRAFRVAIWLHDRTRHANVGQAKCRNAPAFIMLEADEKAARLSEFFALSLLDDEGESNVMLGGTNDRTNS
jgi:hypothetical protein